MRRLLFAALALSVALSLTACSPKKAPEARHDIPNASQASSSQSTPAYAWNETYLKPEDKKGSALGPRHKNASGHTVQTYRTPYGYTIELPGGWGGYRGFGGFDDDPLCEGCLTVGPLVQREIEDSKDWSLFIRLTPGFTKENLALKGSKSWSDYILQINRLAKGLAKECGAPIVSPETWCLSYYDGEGAYQYSSWFRGHGGGLYEFRFDERDFVQVDVLNSIRFGDEKPIDPLRKSPSGQTVKSFYNLSEGYSMDLPVGWGSYGSFPGSFYDHPFCGACEEIGPPGLEDSDNRSEFTIGVLGKLDKERLQNSGLKSWKEYFLKKELDSDEKAVPCTVRITSPEISCFSVYDKDGYSYSEWLRENEGSLYEFSFNEKEKAQVDALNSIVFQKVLMKWE